MSRSWKILGIGALAVGGAFLLGLALHRWPRLWPSLLLGWVALVTVVGIRFFLLDAWRTRAGSRGVIPRPVAVTPSAAAGPVDPEAKVGALTHRAEVASLTRAIHDGLCPSCGAAGFVGEEVFQHSLSSIGRDGRRGGGQVYEVTGRCLTCARSWRELDMR